MTWISKSACIDKLDDILNKNNTYHCPIKTKPAVVKHIYTESGKEINYQDPKLQTGVAARILKYKNIFAKGYVTN